MVEARNEPPWTLQSLNMNAELALDRCPFCASPRLSYYEYCYSKLFVINCNTCGAQGPRHSLPEEARALWNKRVEKEGGAAKAPEVSSRDAHVDA